MRLIDIAAIAMDEEVAENGAGAAGGQNLPPDLLAHDRKYHHGHYDGKSKCKYREDRKAALEGKQESEWNDIIDKLTPENVDGEEIDNADRLEGASAAPVSPTAGDPEKKLADLKSMLGLMSSDLGKAILGKFVKKAEGACLGPKLAKLREFAKSLGLDPSKISYGNVVSASGNGRGGETASTGKSSDPVELKAKKERLEKDMDMIREKMQNASPRLAALLQQQLEGMEKTMKDIGKKLSGAGEKDDKDAEKERKRKEKEAKKAAVAESKKGQDGVAPGVTLDSISDISGGKTTVLSSEDFKKEFAALPESKKIYALSDFHDAGVKTIDPSKHGTAIFAGDFTKHGATSHSKNIDMASAIKTGNEWLQKKFFKFCDKHKDQQIVLIAGNHDHFLGDDSADGIQWPSNVNYLKDSEAIVNGMRIYGTPWCEQRKGAAKTASMSSSVAQQPFEISDEAIKEKFDKIPEGLDILVVHQTPQFDYKDAQGNDIGPDVACVGGTMKHCGSAALTEAIKRAKPKLVICGHLHDGDHRPYKIGDTVVVNGAYVANRGDPAWTAHEIGVKTSLAESNGGGHHLEWGFFVDGENNHQLTK